MTNSNLTGQMSTEEDRVTRIAEKCRQAIGLTTENPTGDAALEALLDGFIAACRNTSGNVIPFTQRPNDAIAWWQSEELVLKEEPWKKWIINNRRSPVLVEDPRRPHFGNKQVRSSDGLHAGLELRVRGYANARLECHHENSITVDTIANALNDDGRVTIVSAPFETTPDGRLVIIVKYVDKTIFNNEKESVSRIYLDELSVVPTKDKTKQCWAIDAWLERR